MSKRDWRCVDHSIVLDLLRPHKNNQKITQLLSNSDQGTRNAAKELLSQL